MNREFKFRVWDKMLNLFLTQEYSNDGFGLTLNGEVSFCFESNFGYVNPKNKDRFVIQQFTGLLDKNEKEIYEGDIVKFKLESEFIAEVVWFYNGFYFKTNVDLWPRREFPAFDILNNNKTEIIGNIFENPELIKQTLE